MIRSLAIEDMPDIKSVIDACGLFPSQLLDGMVASYFQGGSETESWLTYQEETSVAIAYYATERMTQGTWNLLLIAVHPNSQGKGIGGSLVKFVEQTLRVSGQRLLLVEISGLPNFEATRQFYFKCGFEQEARVREYYKAGEDKIVFRKLL